MSVMSTNPSRVEHLCTLALSLHAHAGDGKRHQDTYRRLFRALHLAQLAAVQSAYGDGPDDAPADTDQCRPMPQYLSQPGSFAQLHEGLRELIANTNDRHGGDWLPALYREQAHQLQEANLAVMAGPELRKYQGTR